MKISSVQAYGSYRNYYQTGKNKKLSASQHSSVNFSGGHEFTKAFAGICGVLGTAGAVGGMLIMTGGLGAAVLPWIAGYGAASAGAGAIIGHQVDKAGKEDKNNA